MAAYTEKRTEGTVLSVKKQWWLKVNTKAVRLGPLDGARFPHIVTVEYMACKEKIKNILPNIELVRLIHVASDGTICTDYKKMIYADYYLLDSFNLKTNQVGGTGLTHDWHKSAELIKKLNKPTFLAGGLNPDNVNIAIKIAMPYGVDVNSGCKNETGKKDREKVKQFVANAKA